MTQEFFITLADTGEQVTVDANDWRDALISVNRLDAITVIPYAIIEHGKPQRGFAACHLASLAPDAFPRLIVAESADTAFNEALAAVKEPHLAASP